jgi:hypothetical protein
MNKQNTLQTISAWLLALTIAATNVSVSANTSFNSPYLNYALNTYVPKEDNTQAVTEDKAFNNAKTPGFLTMLAETSIGTRILIGFATIAILLAIAAVASNSNKEASKVLFKINRQIEQYFNPFALDVRNKINKVYYTIKGVSSQTGIPVYGIIGLIGFNAFSIVSQVYAAFIDTAIMRQNTIAMKNWSDKEAAKEATILHILKYLAAEKTKNTPQ